MNNCKYFRSNSLNHNYLTKHSLGDIRKLKIKLFKTKDVIMLLIMITVDRETFRKFLANHTLDLKEKCPYAYFIPTCDKIFCNGVVNFAHPHCVLCSELSTCPDQQGFAALSQLVQSYIKI
jgi:hypothetical protein